MITQLSKYRFDENGTVTFKGKPVLTKYDKRGYQYTVINHQTHLIHQLLFKIAGQSTKNKYIIHINGNKADNRIENLDLMTKTEANKFRFEQRKASDIKNGFYTEDELKTNPEYLARQKEIFKDRRHTNLSIIQLNDLQDLSEI